MITYKQAGVNIDAGNDLVNRIKKMAPRVGGFSDGLQLPKGLKEPILIGCADGVGTKLAIAQKLKNNKNIGFDLVGMNVNDLICSGAKPLFFLDYFACSQLDVSQAEQVIKGIAKACKEAQCELLGGETAEMPGFYKPGEYDLAGFATGVVEKNKKLDPKKDLRVGDVLIGLPSSGLHSNGFSLVRKVFAPAEWRKKEKALLSPTRLYVKPILSLLDKLNSGKNKNVKGIVHITGGGFVDNVPRILPKHLSAQINLGSWVVPSIFRDIQKRAHLSDKEMFRTFNMGIGMMVAVSKNHAKRAKRILKGSSIIGKIISGKRNVKLV